MNNNVNMRQLALILLVIIPGGKYLTLPSMLAKQIGTDGWIVISAMLLVDLVCLTFVCWAINLNDRYSLKDILYMTLGKFVTKIIFAVFALFLLARMVTLLTSTYQVFSASFAINTNWLGFYIPVFAVVVFVLSRGFNAIGRVNEVLFTLIVICVICMLVYPATNADWHELMPIMTSAGKMFETMTNYSFWFTDYIFVYFLLADVKKQNNVLPVTLVCFVVGSAFAIFMNMVFGALYGNTAQYYNPAMSKVSQFAVLASISGRLDWLFLSVWMMSIFIKLCVLMFSAYRSICYLLEIIRPTVNWWVVAFIGAVGMSPLFLPVEQWLENALRVLKYPFAAVQYVLPLLMPLLVTVAHRKTVRGGISHEHT